MAEPHAQSIPTLSELELRHNSPQQQAVLRELRASRANAPRETADELMLLEPLPLSDRHPTLTILAGITIICALLALLAYGMARTVEYVAALEFA